MRRAGIGAGSAIGAVGLVAALALAGCGSSSSSGAPGRPTGSSSTTAASTTTPATRPPIAAVTTGGALEVLDPATGAAERTLATGAVGDSVALSPNGRTVYFVVARGCQREIESVPAAGGTPAPVVEGTAPAVSPDGTALAYARQPNESTPGCQMATGNPASEFAVVVRRLATGSETTYPLSPQAVASGLPMPIMHLSWAPDSRRLAVSVSAPQDNEGWQTVVFDPATSNYYVGPGATPVPVTGADAGASYYREAVFQPDGDLFVNRVCCSGIPIRTTSSLMLTVDPSSGATVRQIAVGFTDVDHSSLDVDRSGHWLLYLSGSSLYVSDDGARPTSLATGLAAAAW